MIHCDQYLPPYEDEVHEDDTDKIKQLTKGNALVPSENDFDWGTEVSPPVVSLWQSPLKENWKTFRLLVALSTAALSYQARINASLVHFGMPPSWFTSGATPADLLVAMPPLPSVNRTCSVVLFGRRVL